MEFDAICADISKHWGASPEATLNGIDHSYPFDRMTHIDPVSLKKETQKFMPLTPQNIKQTKPRMPKVSPKQTEQQQPKQVPVQIPVMGDSSTKEVNKQLKGKVTPKVSPVKVSLPKQVKPPKGPSANVKKEVAKSAPKVIAKSAPVPVPVALENQSKVAITTTINSAPRIGDAKYVPTFQSNEISFEDVCASLAATVHARMADAYVQQHIINLGSVKAPTLATQTIPAAKPVMSKPMTNPVAISAATVSSVQQTTKAQTTKSPKQPKPRANSKTEEKTAEAKKRKRVTQATPKSAKVKASEKAT